MKCILGGVVRQSVHGGSLRGDGAIGRRDDVVLPAGDDGQTATGDDRGDRRRGQRRRAGDAAASDKGARREGAH